MKNPRVDDFDPNAAPAKPLASPLDDFPVIEKPVTASPTPAFVISTPSPLSPPVEESPLTQAKTAEPMPSNKPVRMQTYVQSILRERAPYSYTFRYPPSILEALDQVMDNIQHRFQRKLHKNTIPILALAFLLWDYEANDTESILYQELVLKQG